MWRQPNVSYIVKQGDSLFTIARSYGITVEQLKNFNGLDSDDLYVGQQILIPVSIYRVQGGDSLYSIARKFNTTVESLMTLNNLNNINLSIGQILYIPLYTEAIMRVNVGNIRENPNINSRVLYRMDRGAKLPIISVYDDWYKVRLFNGTEGFVSRSIVDFKTYGNMKPVVVVDGFYTLEEGEGLPSSYESFVNNKNLISELGLFMFRLDPDNATSIENFGDFTDDYIKEVVDIAHRNNIRVLGVVHNLLYRPGGTTKAKDLVKSVVSTKENRQIFTNNLITLIEKYNFDGVNIDIEDVYIEDKDNLSALYLEMGEELRKKGYFLSASVPARVSDEPFNPFSDPFDYRAIGNAVDEFIVMLYNEHGWPGSGPGPVVSIGWMDRVLDYAVTRIPRNKIVAAVSVFGFDFNVTTGETTYVTHAQAMEIAERYGKEIIFDEETKTPMFSYVDENGNNHEVWFENAESIYAKSDLAFNKGIKGIALWRLGMEDDKIWDSMQKDIVVKMA
ncbi:LysM peptidoglycan-binding domain-containing protein [Clostridium sp. L74]|uniref:LysM peptidoglycan-binding domain-containing protein n=1 Tax=Clostridium sp. L74 TaxID=1560217 RepID=UPI0006ABB961|nr:LysM peptidoglycan-binding domain-containing protein [Clostridium sp. L74]KOR25519.1 glycosyl hydrolase [Clostridium sp. L74]